MSAFSTRRVGAEGERVLVATLFFNLKEGAENLGDLASKFESFGSYFNWLSIRYKDQINPGELPVTAGGAHHGRGGASQDSNVVKIPYASPAPDGFSWAGSLRKDLHETYFPSSGPLHFLTVFFRLKGPPGSSFEVLPSLIPRPRGPCARTHFSHQRKPDADPALNPFLTAFSTRHAAGTVRIVEGEVTRPDPPALPPIAKVYDEAPTPETASIHFELEGAVAQPGAKEVPMPLYVTSNHEFAGFSASVRFPAGDLELARVEEHTRPGVVSIDNAAGHLGMYLQDSRRRVGAEGERVKLATLYFNLKEGAGSSGPIEPRFEGKDPFLNWLDTYHLDLANDQVLPIAQQVEPLVVASALVRVQNRPTSLGDVNLDYVLDLGDAVGLLGHMFQGGALLCSQAADFNQDARVDISDPIAILGFLFLGKPGPASREVLCSS